MIRVALLTLVLGPTSLANQNGDKAVPADSSPQNQQVANLIKSLDSDQSGKREATLNALKTMGPAAREAIPALVKALSAYPEQPACHWIASEALANIGADAVPALEQAAKSDDVTLGVWASAALLSNQIDNKALWHRISEAIKGKDQASAVEALRAVEMLGPKAAPVVSDVIEALKELGQRKDEALRAISCIGPAASPAFPEVLATLDTPNPLTKVEALRAIKEMGAPNQEKAIPKLIAALDARDSSDAFVAGEQPRIRQGAAEALGALGPKAHEALPGLVTLLDDKDEFVRTAAVEAIGHIDPLDSSALPGVLKAMRDRSSRVQYAANKIVSELGPVNIEVMRGLILAIRDNAKSFGNPGQYIGPIENIVPVSTHFIDQLGTEHRYAVPDFVALAKDPNPGVQALAIIALTNIRGVPEDFVPMLADRLRTSQWEWVEEKALESLGSKAAPAVPVLIDMLGDSHRRTMAAPRILGTIGRPAADPAIPVLERLVKAAPPPEVVSLCESLLRLDPNSAIALDGLRRHLADPKTNSTDAQYTQLLLSKYDKSSPGHN